MLDFVNLYKNRGTDFSIEWHFDRRMTDGMKNDVIELLQKEFRKSGDSAKELQNMLGVKLDTDVQKQEWEEFLVDLQDQIPNMIHRVDNTF